MADASTAVCISFSTKRSGNRDADSMRLDLAAALRSAGAAIDTTMDPHEVDWVFYGDRNGMRFTVVLVEDPPHIWFTFIEGPNSDTKPDRSVRTWALSVMETALQARDDTDNVVWHDSFQTLPKS